MHRSHIERTFKRSELTQEPFSLVGAIYSIDDAHYRIESITPQFADSDHHERDTFLLMMVLLTCDYHEPTSEAQWQGHDKLARNTRHGKPVKYACHLCRHFLSNPVPIASVPTTQEKPVQANQAGLL